MSADLKRDKGNRRTIAEIDLGVAGYTWRVDSDCGVVKVHSSRDGCMIALNPEEARTLADDLFASLREAADSVDSATAGGPR